MKKLIFYTDAGHGWLEVSKKEMPDHLVEKISRYSYQDKDNYYLEEDCDAGIYLDYLSKNNIEFKIEEKYTDHSFIRDL